MAPIQQQALAVHGAMLMEPTESESKKTLEQYILDLKVLTEWAKAGNANYSHEAPKLTPRRRLDEAAAARRPILRWHPPIRGRSSL